jgi:2-polyprenyl-6-hydroxyphenyl methylase/3-demethylubiquinone-9 3-methyltransferase
MKRRLSRDELKGFYEGSYVDDYRKKSVRRLERLVPLFHLDKDDVVVDIGCGDGMLSQVVHGRVGSYVGVDFSERFIAAAQERARSSGIGNTRFVRADIVEFCAENRGRFDAAFTMDFSEHIDDEDFHRIYTAVRDSLKKGGSLYLHTPNRDYFLEILKHHGIIRQFPEHIAVRRDRHYIRLLDEAGFSNISLRYLPHYNVMRYLHFLSAIPLVGRYFRARLFIVSKR